MRNLFKINRFCTLLAGSLLVLCSVSVGAAEYYTPEFARAEFRPRAMVLIPPMAEVVKNKVSSTEQMIEEAGVLEDATTLVLQQQMGALGYEINVLTVDAVNADPELQQMVRSFNERYDADSCAGNEKTEGHSETSLQFR